MPRYQLLYKLLSQYPHLVLLLGVLVTMLLSLLILTRLLGWGRGILALLILSGLILLIRAPVQRMQILRMQRQARALVKIAQFTYPPETFTSWTHWPVDVRTREAVETFRKATLEQEIIIGRIDADGRVLGLFGELPGLKSVDLANFVAQRRYRLDIVLSGNSVLVRKDFCGNKIGFLQEWYNLALLYGKVNVPAIYRVDEDRCWLYKNLIVGQTIRDILVNSGARILIVQTRDDPELVELDQDSCIEAVWARGRAAMPACFSQVFLAELEQQFNKLHAYGMANLSLTFGNIMRDSQSGAPWFIDFEGAQHFRSTFSPVFIYRRRQDRIKFSQIYGLEFGNGKA